VREPDQETARKRDGNGEQTPAQRGGRSPQFRDAQRSETVRLRGSTVLEHARVRMMPTAGCTSGRGDAGDRNPKG
jgi:hypothetical protein